MAETVDLTVYRLHGTWEGEEVNGFHNQAYMQVRGFEKITF